MIRTLRALFLGRLLSEKLLLVVFILICVIAWLTLFTKRAQLFNNERVSVTRSLNEQQQWLNNRQKIEAQAASAAARLEPARTLDSVRLIQAVSQAAYDAGLRNNYGNSGSPGKETNGQFTIHTVDFQVTNADFVALQKFYLNLHKRAPYIGIETFTLTANRTNPALLTLGLRVSSVEIPR